MKRTLKYGLITVAVLFVGLAGAVWFVAATETGTRLLWRQAQAFLPEDARVRALEGRLTGPLVVQGVELRTETMHLALERAELEWSPRALLTGLVHIQHLELEGLHVTQTGTPPEAEPAEPFELPEQVDPPAAVRLDALRLRGFEFRAAPGADPFTVTRAGLAAGLDREGLVVDRVTLRSPLVDLDGHARVGPRGDYPVEGRLNWRVRPPGYAAADATTRLSGTLRALVVNQEIAAPYNFQARVSIADVLREPRFDGELTLSDTALAAIGGELPPATVSADAGFRGTSADLELSADLRGRAPLYGPVRAEIRGGLADQTFTLEQLLVERPDTPARARADGVIRLAGAQPDMDVNLRWEALRWPLDGEAAVTSPRGRATASGTPQDLAFQIQGQAQAPEAGAFDLSLDGRLAGPVIELGQVRLTEQEGPAVLNASGRVTLEDEGPGVDLTAQWQRGRWPLNGEPVVTSPSGSVAVQGSLEDVTARLHAGLGEAGHVTGDISRRKQRIDVALDWRTLTWPLTGSEAGVTSPRGTVRLSGTLADYDLSLDARVDVPEHTGGRVVLEGAGSLEAVELERIVVNALEGTLSGTARARWSPALDVAVDLRGDGLNPAPVLAGWPGKLGLDIKGQARMEDGRWQAQLERAEAFGVLRGYEVDLDARGGYDGKTLSLEHLSLASGGTRVSAQGEIGEALDVGWQINSGDLGQLLPEAGGRLDGAGTARGSLRRPRVAAELEGEDLRYRGYSAATLDLDASIDAGGEENSELSLTIENGSAAGVEIDRLRLTGSGNARAHSLELAAQTSSGTADLAVTGTVENPWQADAAWVGELSRATLDYPELAPWRLQEAAAVRIDAARASVSRHCWQSGTARLCLEGERAVSGLAARFELDRLDFAYFAALLPRNLRVEGAVGGSGRISRAAEGPLAATVGLRTTSGRIGTADTGGGGAADGTAAGEAPAMVAFRESDIRFELGEQGLQADVDMRLEQGGFRLQASVPGDGAPFLERPLSGRITTEVPELSFIAELIPDLEQIDGRLEGDMKLGGSPGAPVLQGELALIDGTAVLSAPGLTLSEVRVNLIGKGEGGLRLDAAAKSGGGTLEVEGEADLTGEAATASIAIKGRDFQVFNTAEAQVYASPDLNVNVGRERIDITGEVAIPRADITPQKIPESAVTVSGDQVIVEPGSEEVADSPGRAADRAIHSEVRVILGDRVRVNGFGLKARFEGDLRVVEKPGEPITGSGEIQIVEGKYKAYGQDLTIEDGRILFPGGPITEPGLDVRAVRRPREDVLVGVKVRGNLREPKFTLFSEPAMTQQEQLSYLVLGRSLQESSGAESSAINQAALALGLKSGDFLARNIGRNIGIDEVEVASGTTGSGTRQASLVLGKYLSPDLYISYGIGLLEPVSTVRLQYAISSKWKLVTESSGNQSSGDIIYTIERGK